MKFEKYRLEKDYEHIYYFLKESGFSESFITSLRKKEGSILLNNKPANTRTKLKTNDVLQINLDAKTKSNFEPNDDKLDIVFEDDYILVVNKPANYCTSPSKSHYNSNLSGAILGYMKKQNPEFVLRIKNRLDKDTSGLIIVAKDIISYNNITNINKNYHAICYGNITKNIIIDKPIQTLNKNGINEIKRFVSDDGKPAKTYVKPLKQLKDSTLIELNLEFGRTHQIRVHLSSIGHPLIGDEVYGKKSEKISHTALICKKISFNHPRTNEEIMLEIDYPDDFSNLLENI